MLYTTQFGKHFLSLHIYVNLRKINGKKSIVKCVPT